MLILEIAAGILLALFILVLLGAYEQSRWDKSYPAPPLNNYKPEPQDNRSDWQKARDVKYAELKAKGDPLKQLAEAVGVELPESHR